MSKNRHLEMIAETFADNKYLVLLVAILALTILFPLGVHDRLMVWVLTTCFILTMLSVIYVNHQGRFIFYILVILGITISVAEFTSIVLSLDLKKSILTKYGLMLIFCSMSIVMLLKEIARKNVVTKDIVIGALCVYFLLGVIYAGIYYHVLYYDPAAFDMSKTLIKTNFGEIFNLMYFSFCTLTTLGYGDIIPISLTAKSVAIAEMVTGIFYLAVLVSRLVTSFNRNP